MTILRFRNRTLIVADEVMKKTIELASRAAQSSFSVLLCGESGTGKELIARYIHEKSTCSNFPFVSINCAAIPEGLLEAELFGYEKGAFTGAVARHLGKFERADRGTLLLDEISEMPVHLQTKLLRVLQEEEVDRIGGGASIPVNVRIIATTNRDPLKLIAEKKFREDLFYRLNVIRIDCAPLRGRERAIVLLAREFLKRSAFQHGRQAVELGAIAAEMLQAHLWPGNVRELQNAIERAVFLCEGEILECEHFEQLISRHGDGVGSVDGSLAAVERQHIMQILGATRGNRTNAARILGITTRTLRNKLREYQS